VLGLENKKKNLVRLKFTVRNDENSSIVRNTTDQVYFTINAAHQNILGVTVGSEMMYRVYFFLAWPIRAGPTLCFAS
jgi:hypothetical protein